MAFMGKGLGTIKEQANKGGKLTIESGKAAEIRILTPADEIISVYEHTVQIGGQWKTITCLGRNDCPLCLTGDKASFKVYLSVLDRADGKVKYWKVSKTVGLQLIGLSEEYGDLSSRDYKVVRQGEKLQTTYQFFPRDPKAEDLSKYEQPDLETMVQPLSKETILAMMAGGLSSSGGPEPGDNDAPPAGNSKDYPF